MKILFYKGKGKWGNALIRWWTNSIYSHCEIEIDGFIYSSSLMDGGIRKKSSAGLHVDDWDSIDLSFLGEDVKSKVLSYFSSTEGLKYDIVDLFLNQIINTNRVVSRGSFCSDWCAQALDIPHSALYSPETLKGLLLYIKSIKEGGGFNEGYKT